MNPFDIEANSYDEWFDSPTGRAIFSQELACLRELIGKAEGRWLEVGVGTGRFAQALGIREGIDPSLAALSYASNRGIRTQLGYAENLPYSQNSFDGILMVVTLCFLADPVKAFDQCRRVLKDEGRLIVGLVPTESYPSLPILPCLFVRSFHRLYGWTRCHESEDALWVFSVRYTHR